MLDSKKIKLEETTSDAISSAASQVVKTVFAKAIFTYTRSGGTAKRAARERPSVPIIGLSPERRENSKKRRLCCYYSWSSNWCIRINQ